MLLCAAGRFVHTPSITNILFFTSMYRCVSIDQIVLQMEVLGTVYQGSAKHMRFQSSLS